MDESSGKQGQERQLIFDRPEGDGHPFSGWLANMGSNPDAGKNAFCGNIRADWRVPVVRENSMLSFEGFRDNAGRDCLYDQWKSYYYHEIQRPLGEDDESRKPAYLREFNGFNLVPARIPPFYGLIHVSSFNRMVYNLISDAENGNSGIFRAMFEERTGLSLPDVNAGSGIPIDNFNIDSVASELNKMGERAVKEIAGLLCRSYGKSRRPWWACFADDADKLIDNGDWAGLCSCLGMGHINDGEWILVWRYKKKDVDRLYRPTVVEAYDSPFHFPSPPSSIYGVTMPLKDGYPCFREIIHDAPGEPVFTETCDGVLRRVEGIGPAGADYNSLTIMREAHRGRLLNEFKSVNDMEWIKRHGANIAESNKTGI